jgi:hypothetical protein
MKYEIKVIIVLILGIIVLLSFSAKGCINRTGNKTKSGSSNYNTFMINAPSNFTAAAVSSLQINLSWQDNSNNEDGFEIERRIGLYWTWTFLDRVIITSYTNRGLVRGITYYYRVRAYNNIGDNSVWSNEANAIITWNPLWSAVSAGSSYTLALTGSIIEQILIM